MSGFLHQLASRSLGLAPQVRSRAALPYAPPAADLSLPEAAGHEAPHPAGAVERAENGSIRTADGTAQITDNTPPAPVVAEKPEHTARLDRQDSTPPAAPDPRLADRQSPLKTEPRGDFPLRGQPAPPTDKTAPTSLTARPNPAPRQAEPAPAVRYPADKQPSSLVDIESLVARLLGDQQNDPATSPETATPPSIARPSRPGTRPAEIATILPSASRERPTVAAEPASAPDVHITIGRLEVNPPSRPAPAAPPRPRGPAPLSLSDYLARRNGGRP